MTDYSELLNADPKEVFKHDARSRVWLAQAGDGPVVFKRFEYSPPRQALAAMLGVHPGQREQRLCDRMRKAGLPVVAITAAGSTWHGLGKRYWLATPYIGMSLHNQVLRDRLPAGPRRDALLTAVGRLTGELIRLGLFNRDHKASNILIDSDHRPWLIDVGAVRRLRGSAGAERMLANLCDTLTQAGATEADLALVRRASGINPDTDPNA